MARRMWMLFILTMATAKAEDSSFVDDKESRFLSLFTITQGAPPSAAAAAAATRPLPPRSIAPSARCASRLESALDQIKRRQMLKARSNEIPVQMIDLDGYSLHQQLRSAPMDMYVTRMRVRLPQNQNWVRIERCHFDPRNVSLETRLLFNDLTISGSVNLFDGQNELGKMEDVRERDRDTFYDNMDFRGDIYKRQDVDVDRDERHRERYGYYDRNRRDCNMILRLRKAGIGFFTQPLKQSPGRFSVKTDSEFIEPGFISVYAYGCERYISRNKQDYDRNYQDDDDYKNNVDRRYKRDADYFSFEPVVRESRHMEYRRRPDDWDRYDSSHRVEKSKLFGPDDRLEDLDDISREMEDIFTKGIRSLLTTYMQKELQPAIKETLMRNLGYTISYG